MELIWIFIMEIVIDMKCCICEKQVTEQKINHFYKTAWTMLNSVKSGKLGLNSSSSHMVAVFHFCPDLTLVKIQHFRYSLEWYSELAIFSAYLAIDWI